MTLGSTFGDYRVVRRLGKGGMGEVWLLEGKSGGRIAAKILDATADHEARKRFLREAQLALGVKHPNLVETYDVGEDPETGLCYILMEYVPGGTLADHIKANGALAIEDAVAVVEAIACVLELGRRKGIVHRDIKPANIMFGAKGTPKLADLGIARAGAGAETTTVTQTGMMIGTPAYMAPEQMLDSHNVDTRADIYSLGVVFFEMLTGLRPNKGATVVQLLAKAMKGEPIPDVRTVRKDVPAPIAKLINRMVEPNLNNRISTPRQISNILAVIARGAAPTTPDPSPTGRGRSPSAPDSSPAGFPKWLVLVLVLVLAALVGALIIFASKPAFTMWSVRPRADNDKREDISHSRQGEEALITDDATASLTNQSPEAIETVAVETNTPPEAVAPPVALTNAVASCESNAVSSCESNAVAAASERMIPTLAKPVKLPPQPVSDPEPLTHRLPDPSHRASLPDPPSEPIRPLPSPAVKPNLPAQDDSYECEFVPRIRDWRGHWRYPTKTELVSVNGCTGHEIVRRTTNSFGGESVIVSLRGKLRGLCFLTFEAEGKKRTVSVQLKHPMPKSVEVNLED